MGDLWRNELLRRATIDAMVMGALCGAVGVHVVLRRLPFFAVSLAHATFPGIVVADLMGIPPLLGALVVGWCFAGTVGTVGRTSVLDDTSLVGVLLAGSFGLGVLLQALDDSPSRQLANVLTGSVLAVSWTEVIVTAIGAALVALVLVALHKELTLSAFDPAGAGALGYGPWLETFLLVLVASAVVTSIPAVGTILAVAMLAMPALAARCWADRMGTTIALSSAIGSCSGLVGMWISYEADIAAGPAITLTAGSVLTISALAGPHGGLLRRRSQRAVPVATA